MTEPSPPQGARTDLDLLRMIDGLHAEVVDWEPDAEGDRNRMIRVSRCEECGQIYPCRTQRLLEANRD